MTRSRGHVRRLAARKLDAVSARITLAKARLQDGANVWATIIATTRPREREVIRSMRSSKPRSRSALAQDARWLADGNRLMSAPVSAMITSARAMEIPGMVMMGSRSLRKVTIATSIWRVSSSIALVCWSIRSRWSRTKKA
jgi:hypothetical protein